MKHIIFISYFFIFSSFFLSLTSKYQNNKTELDKNIPVPLVLSPAVNFVADSICTFTWTNSGKKIKYELWVSDNLNFNSCKQYIVKDTTFTCFLGAETNDYKYCKVRAWKKSKLYSEWSAVVAFAHGEIFKEFQQEIKISPGGCNGNCANCKHPCGRRRLPKN
ncbi:MAG: hypothetical protein A2309_11730 [Bacteroidetes bacterium RIFOXYB2_FULL_35_7]|nr:MAG: hypothetical protein A2X01_08035 [Bacteroidetes bacterium GWF2_35_48]OFY94319.1 MAG: hypothetical protein A2309_11730 [Bacteroidetes bacterium RIFOXYB2_FULL_35_7]OFZ06152.1 MAG: hypothetical protein A2491_12290 [Bacteroidetes bacterium RIFOXYC12_FULL_35_7]HBX52642.1 hypothetical protein [Bacteroidales bacterium]